MLDDLPESLAAHALAVHVDEQRRFLRISQKLRTHLLHVVRKCLDGGGIERDDTLFALALRADEARAQAHVLFIELKQYFDAFLSGGVNRPFSVRALGETLLCYFRAPGIVFLLGFASIGIVAVPLVCACQGFLLSYSLFCFALSLGRGSFPLLLALFGIRLLAVLPCTLLLGNASLDKSRALLSLSLGGGGRGRAVSYGSAYWYRFGICCVCLLFAALLELWLVPQFLLLAAS